MTIKNQKTIRIFDTTLRDGEQTPGVSLTADDKIEIAHQLSKLGVDVIEAGFPSSSDGERKVVKDIAKAGLTSEICALSRATRGDIDAALECDVDLVHVFIPTSPVQMQYAVNLTPEQVLAATVDSIEYVKKHGVKCEFSPMDATRSEMPFLKQVCKAAQDADRKSVV
jgi:2-isopropylmalate synthase